MSDRGRYVAKAFHLVRDLTRRRLVERDLDEEVDAIVDLLADEKMRTGLDAVDARRAAASELGGIERLKALVRSEWSTVENCAAVVRRDLRLGVAHITRTPLVTATAALVLAIGIATNLAVFSAVRNTTAGAPDSAHDVALARSLPAAAQLPVDSPFFQLNEPGPSPFVGMAAWPAAAPRASRAVPSAAQPSRGTGLLASLRSSRPRRDSAGRAQLVATPDDAATLRLQARVTSPP